jgi:uncharacterized metal-binding protein YceD (DUF177 family)
MEIEFKKIPINGIEFEALNKNLKFSGTAIKELKKLVLCEGKLTGSLIHQCDRCGDEFNLEINEEIILYANDGVYESGKELLNVIEFYDSKVNFDTMLQSEIGTIESDYYYCTKCK